MKIESILVSGGMGFIGRHLIEKLKKEQHCSKIIIVDNLSNAQASSKNVIASGADPKIKFYRADIRDKSTVSDIMKHEKTDACVHLAAKMSVEESVRNPEEVVEGSFQGGRILV